MAPYGISVDTAASGFEAIEKIRNGSSYDIIFMDHMMPRMDGIEATKIIRDLGYKNPIVALTANALAGQAEIFLKNGFDDYISKPIDIRQLNSALNKLIRDKQPEEVIKEARRQKNHLYAAGKHNIAVEPQLAEYFRRDAKKAIRILSMIYENNCRREADVSAYIINIHSMKSALANVGENGLSEEAAQLEQIGRDNNVELILSSLPAFLEKLNKVVDKFDTDEEDAAGSADEQTIDLAVFKEKLKAIQDACASYDKKAAKTALSELKQMHYRVAKEQLSLIDEHLLHSEFDEASAVANQIQFS